MKCPYCAHDFALSWPMYWRAGFRRVSQLEAVEWKSLWLAVAAEVAQLLVVLLGTAMLLFAVLVFDRVDCSSCNSALPLLIGLSGLILIEAGFALRWLIERSSTRKIRQASPDDV